MKLTKHLRVLVRIRDYETVQIEVGAEADFRDLGIADPDAAHMRPEERIKYTDQLHTLVSAEVNKLLRAELENAARYSEIHPNLADDYLSAYTPRSPDARRTTTDPAAAPASRRIRRRGSGGGANDAPARPTQPATTR